MKKLMISRWAPLAVATLLAALAACSDDTNSPGDVDVDEPKCGDGTCDAGETPDSCPADCEDEPDSCGNGTCDAGETPDSCPDDCAPEESCADDGDCGPGEICEGEACQEGCREDDDCGQGELCLSLSCVESGVGCRQDEDCNEGFVCDEGNERCVEDMGQCIDDANEPNDNTAEASELGEGIFENLSICGIDNDYFAFALEPGDRLTATILFGAGLALQIVDEDSQPVAESAAVAGGRRVSFTATEAGDFFARVFPAANAGEVNAEYILDAAVLGVGDICEEDDSEPNNAIGEATALTEAGLQGRAACAGDADFYRFEVPEGGTAVASIRFEHDEGDLTLVLLDADGDEVSRSAGAGDTETVRVAQAGTFFAQVTSASEAGGSTYAITLLVAEGGECTPDAFEPNNALESAAEVEIGAHEGLVVCDGDDDFFAVELGALDALTVTLNFDGDAGDIDFEILDTEGESIGGSFGVGDVEEDTVEASVAGTYFIAVGLFGEGSNGYSMTLGVVEGPEPPECADGFEPNNDAEGATALGQGIEGATVCADDPDVYSFTVAEDRSLVTLTATSELAFGDVEIELLDADGQRIIARSNTRGNPETVRSLVGAAGTYFARVLLASGETTAYDLSAAIVPPPPCDDPFEPNEAVDAATPLTTAGVQAAVACIDEVDFYEIEILEPFTRVDISATFADTFGDVDLELFDTDGQTSLIAGERRGPGESVSFLLENTGVYFLRAALAEGTNTAYNLAMRFTVLPNCNDVFEPNNSTDEATPLAVGTYPALTVCGGVDVNDFFAIEIVETTIVDITILFTDADGDIDMRLLDTDGTTQLRSSTSSSDNEQISLSLEPGTYFIQVFSFGGASNTYDMIYSFVVPAECVDVHEPNDAPEISTNLNSPVQDAVACDDGDVDFYDINVTEVPADLTVTATFNNTFGHIDMELLDLDGVTVLDTGDGIGATESVTARINTPGTYLVRAFLAEGGQNVAYNIRSTLRGAVVCDDPFEENDIRADAALITPGTYNELTVCTGGDPDTNDFYAIYLEAGDAITVDILFLNADGDIDLTLFDIDGTTALDTSASISDNEQVEATARNSGFHLINVRMFSTNREAFYDMIIDAPERTPPVCEDDGSEPNNEPNEATLIDGPIEGLKSCRGDVDLFRVNVPAGQILNATLDFPHAQGNLALDLRDADGQTVLLTSDISTANNSLERIIFRAPASADYFLAVRGVGFAENTYDLAVEVLDTLPVGPCQDRFEPNNAPGGAFPLEAGTFEGLDICFDQDEQDFFAVELPGNTILTVTAFFDVDVADLGLSFIDRDRTTVLGTFNDFADNDSGRIIIPEDAGGTYYIEVFFADFFADGNTYDLQIAIEENNCVDDGREPDNEPFSAPLLDADTYSGQICSGDTDFIQFIANGGDTISASLSFRHADGNLGLRLLDQDGTTVLATANTTRDVENLLFRIEEAGLYFLEVFGAGLSQNSYELEFGFGACDDVFEPNNAFSVATPVDFGQFNELDLCTPNVDRSDFFAIDLAANQAIRVTVSFIDANGDIDMRLLDTNGTTTLASSGGISDTETIDFTAPAAGTYFIEVFLFTTPGRNTYSMLIEER